jgi:uncharacterized protein
MQTIEATEAARATGLDAHTLGLTIFPTEKCNLRCVYCYETFPNIRLNDEVSSSIRQLLAYRAGDLRHLSIGWFGGEPLLEAAAVLEISRFARNLSILHKFSFL